MKDKICKLDIDLAIILIISATCFFYGCSPQTGVRSGQVLNAVNDEPIQGAVVYFDWRFGGLLGFGPLGGDIYETSTDKDGKYYVPSQTINKPNFMYGGLYEHTVLIYKDGYEVYYVAGDRIGSPVAKPTGYPDGNQVYHEKNNISKLYPWKEGQSHYDHMNWINTLTFWGKGELLKKELEPEKERADKDLSQKVKEWGDRYKKQHADK